MSPSLSAAIYAARELAWHPHVNLSSRERYAARTAAHERLCEALGRVTGLSANAGPELRYLVEAMHRTAACSFSNRMGAPYAARKAAMAELRGCLLAYDRAREAGAAAGRALPPSMTNAIAGESGPYRYDLPGPKRGVAA